MKKAVLTFFILIVSLLSFADIFLTIDSSKIAGAGWYDTSNLFSISVRDITYSYRYTFADRFETSVGLNINMNNPIKNNYEEVNIGAYYNDFKVGFGIWNTFFDPGKTFPNETSIYNGNLGIKSYVGGRLGSLLFGGTLSLKFMDIVFNEEYKFSYYYTSLPRDLGLLNSFSGYLGYNLYENETLKVDLKISFGGSYSIIQNMPVFFRFDDTMTPFFAMNIYTKNLF